MYRESTIIYNATERILKFFRVRWKTFFLNGTHAFHVRWKMFFRATSGANNLRSLRTQFLESWIRLALSMFASTGGSALPHVTLQGVPLLRKLQLHKSAVWAG